MRRKRGQQEDWALRKRQNVESEDGAPSRETAQTKGWQWQEGANQDIRKTVLLIADYFTTRRFNVVPKYPKTYL